MKPKIQGDKIDALKIDTVLVIDNVVHLDGAWEQVDVQIKLVLLTNGKNWSIR